MRRHDAVVLGTGHNGLVAACCPVKADKAVALRLTTGEEFRADNSMIAALHPRVLSKFVAGTDPAVERRNQAVNPSPQSLFALRYDLREVVSRLGDNWSPLILMVLATGSFRHATLKRLIGGLSAETARQGFNR